MLTVSSCQPPSGTWLLKGALQKFAIVIFYEAAGFMVAGVLWRK